MNSARRDWVKIKSKLFHQLAVVWIFRASNSHWRHGEIPDDQEEIKKKKKKKTQNPIKSYI
jgi:hypothetical protein